MAKKPGRTQITFDVTDAMAQDLQHFCTSSGRHKTVVLRRAIEMVIETPWTESLALVQGTRPKSRTELHKRAALGTLGANATPQPKSDFEIPQPEILSTSNARLLEDIACKVHPESYEAWYPLDTLCDVYGVSEQRMFYADPLPRPNVNVIDLAGRYWVARDYLETFNALTDLIPTEIAKVHEGLRLACIRAQEAETYLPGTGT